MGRPSRFLTVIFRAGAALAAWALMLAVAVHSNTTPGAAQEPTGSVTVSQLDAASYPEITAVVTVLDVTGAPARGLTAAEFTAADGADPVEVLDAQRVLDTSLSLGVVLAIDVSGSMEGARLDSAKVAAAEFVAQLSPGDRATVLAFSDTVRVAVPFTEDREALRVGIEQLTAGGATSLYEAVGAAAFAAASGLTPRSAIVVLSDGENDTTTSTATEATSLETIRSVSIPVYAIGYGGAADPAFLGRLADTSRGRFFAAREADVGAVYATIADQLRGQYALTLRATAPEDGGEGSLVLTADMAGQRVSSEPATFTRGETPPTPAPTVPVIPPDPTTAEEDEGSSSLLLVSGAIAGAVVLGVLLIAAVRMLLARRRQRRRERHAGRQTDAPLPVPRPGAPIPQVQEHPARVVVLSGERAGDTVGIGSVPIVIGSDAKADLRVAPSQDVAPRHAQLWMRDGKIMLRHIGGQKKTMVQGRAVDWLILDEGDEFSIGVHVYRVEAARNADMPSDGR